MMESVKRTETRYRKTSNSYEYGVDEFPKTPAGYRPVFIPTDQKWIIGKLIEGQMGHTSIQCTEQFYHRNRREKDEKQAAHIVLPERMDQTGFEPVSESHSPVLLLS